MLILQITNAGNTGIMSCLRQGGPCSISVLVTFNIINIDWNLAGLQNITSSTIITFYMFTVI